MNKRIYIPAILLMVAFPLLISGCRFQVDSSFQRT